MAIFRSFLSICDHLFARMKNMFQAVVLVRQLQMVNKKFYPENFIRPMG